MLHRGVEDLRVSKVGNSNENGTGGFASTCKKSKCIIYATARILYTWLVSTFKFPKTKGAGPCVSREHAKPANWLDRFFSFVAGEHMRVITRAPKRATHQCVCVYTLSCPRRIDFRCKHYTRSNPIIHTHIRITVYMYTCKNREFQLLKEQKYSARWLLIFRHCVTLTAQYRLFSRFVIRFFSRISHGVCVFLRSSLSTNREKEREREREGDTRTHTHTVTFRLPID